MEISKFNFALFKKIKMKGLTQRKLSKLVDGDQTKVSRVINGIWNLSEIEKAQYAKALECEVADIFRA